MFMIQPFFCYCLHGAIAILSFYAGRYNISGRKSDRVKMIFYTIASDLR